MKWFKLIFLIVTVFILTGCWNYRELEDLAIVGAIGVDKGDNGYAISVEVLNAKKVASSTTSSSGSDETPSVVYEAEGKTIREALNRIILEAPKKLYIGHMNLLVISEAIAKDGLYSITDFFMRDVESRKIFPIVVVRNTKASVVLKTIKPLETVTSSNIEASLTATSSVSSIVSNRLFDEVLTSLYQEGRHPTVSAIEVVNPTEEGETNDNLSSTEAKTTVKIIGSSVFKNDKLVGYLNTEESLGYTIIRNKVESLTISFSCDSNNYGNVVVDGLSTNLKVNIDKNKPVANINVTGGAALVEYNCKDDLTNESNIKKITSLVNAALKTIINNAINITQTKFSSDIF
ncbi:MAG: Ger(x)C family spore germination protein, partial [Bacilli bacterium]